MRRPDPNTRNSRLAARPVLQPVLGDEPLTLAEADEFQEAEFPGEAVAGEKHARQIYLQYSAVHMSSGVPILAKRLWKTRQLSSISELD